MRDVERNCRTFEPFIPPYTPPNAKRATASKAFEGFGKTFEPFISPYTPSSANRDPASKAFEAFGRAEDALKLLDQGSVNQGSSVSDASYAVPRPKKRRVEAVVSTAASLVVISSVGLMTVLLSPQNKSAATHGVSEAARLDVQTVSLGSGKRTNVENTVGTNDASPVEPNGADESIPSFVGTQLGTMALQIQSTQLVNYWMTISAANPTQAEIRNLPMQQTPEGKFQSAIRELLIRSAYATSHRDLGISMQ